MFDKHFHKVVSIFVFVHEITATLSAINLNLKGTFIKEQIPYQPYSS